MHRRQNRNKCTANKTKETILSNFSMQDLLNGRNLELVAAALLLTGKLKVDSVEIFRGSPVIIVSLLGEYLTKETNKANALADFLEDNGDLTLDDVFNAFQQRMQKGDDL